MIAAGDGVDDTDKSIWLLLPPSNDVEEVDISSLSLIASSANLAKSKRFCWLVVFRFCNDNDS